MKQVKTLHFIDFVLIISCLCSTCGVIWFYSSDKTSEYYYGLTKGLEEGRFQTQEQNLIFLSEIEKQTETYRNVRSLEVFSLSVQSNLEATRIDSLLANIQFDQDNQVLINQINLALDSFRETHQETFKDEYTFRKSFGPMQQDFQFELSEYELNGLEKNLFESKIERYRSLVQILNNVLLNQYLAKVYAPYCGFDAFMPVISYDRSSYQIGDSIQYITAIISMPISAAKPSLTMNGEELKVIEGEAKIELKNLKAGSHPLHFAGSCQHYDGTQHQAIYDYILEVEE
jgi:hypothetical protein